MGIYEHENPCFSETHPRVTAQSLKYSEIAPTKNQTVEFNLFNILVRKGYYLSYITVLEKKSYCGIFLSASKSGKWQFPINSYSKCTGFLTWPLKRTRWSKLRKWTWVGVNDIWFKNKEFSNCSFPAKKPNLASLNENEIKVSAFLLNRTYFIHMSTYINIRLGV